MNELPSADFIAGLGIGLPLIAVVWQIAYDRGVTSERREIEKITTPSRPAFPMLSPEELRVAILGDELRHIQDPGCAQGGTRFEHDEMGICSCI